MKRCRRRILKSRICLLLLLMLLTALACAWADTSGAKALFYDQGDVSVTAESSKAAAEKKPARKSAAATASPSHMGISYWVDLMDEDGKASRTTASHVFKAGDRIKLNVQSNRKGYLYVIGLGSSGNSHVLFPNSEGIANGINAKVTYSVPFGTSLKFDSTPGEETILLVLSQKPIAGIVPGRRLLPEHETRQLVASAATGSKDVILEEVENQAGMQPATYAVVPAAVLGGKGIFSLQIKLKHE